MRTPLLLIVAALAFPVLAAIPPQRPDDLQKNATHIVAGKVVAVYATEVPLDREGMTNRLYAIEVTVTKAEKGEGLAEGKVVFAKCWTPAKRPRGWAGGQGQNKVPAAGETGKLYLAQQADGTYTVLSPNGWAPEGK
ncbi:MAG: hypothetical protein ACAI43_03485 [Phycisphaerae bacterium]|nr:hypothetical protein [Tepidisphaeraceae bacterium]